MAVWSDAPTDLGVTGPDRLTRHERHGARLAKKGHKGEELSEKALEPRCSGQVHLDTDPADGPQETKECANEESRRMRGALVYNVRIRIATTEILG